MPASVGTVFVDVRFNIGDIGRQLQGALRGGAGVGSETGANVGANMERGLAASFGRMGQLATQAGRQLSFAVSAPLALIGRQAVSSFTAFDSEMTKINSLVGVSKDQTAAWSTQVLDLSRSYGVAADESAKALYFITSSGVEGARAIETLDVALKGAAVGLGDVSTVADATTSAMNAYGQENMSAAQAADILTVAVREGKGEADQMAGALSAVIPIASAIGVSYGEVAGAMSAMTLSGTTADEAATQLRALLNTLQDMPPISQKALKSYTGLDYAMVRNKLTTDGLIPTLQEISEAFGDNQTAVAEVFGNIRALTGIQNLFGEKTQQTLSIVRQTTTATGDLNKAFEATSQSASFKLNKAINELKVTMTEVGADMVPMAEAGASAIAKLAQGFAALDPVLQTTVTGFGAMLVVAGPLLYSFGSLATLGKNVSQALTTASPAFANFKASAQRSAEAINENSRANNGLISQLGGINQILGATAIAIGGVVVAWQIWQAVQADAMQKAKAFVGSVQATFDSSKSGFEGANEEISQYDKALEQITAQSESLSAANPFDKKMRDQLRDQWKLTTEAREALAKYMEMAGQMATITGMNRDALLDWLRAEKDADRTYPDAESAVRAYNNALKEQAPAAKAVATASAQTANSMSRLIAASKTAADQYNDLRSAQKGYRDAQRGVTDAEQRLADAQKDARKAGEAIVAADRKILDARRKAVDAANALSDANKRLTDAQNELNDARRGPSEEEKLDVESAELGLEEARKRLKGSFETPLDRRRAQLDVRRAELDLSRAQAAHEQRVADATKGVADAQKGVADSQQNLLDANQGVVDATNERSDAVERQASALRAVDTAQQALVDAQEAVLGAYAKYNDAQRNLGDSIYTSAVNGQAFLDYLNALKTQEPALSGVIDQYIADFERLQAANRKPPEQETDPAVVAWRERLKHPSAANRATGGPLSTGQLSNVNERGIPELWSAGGRQYLLPTTNGQVTPLKPIDIDVKGGDQASVNVGDVYVQGAAEPVQTAYEVRRQLRQRARARGRS